MKPFIIILLSTLLPGCIPHTDNPITDPDKEQIDPLILGTWFWNEENESGYIHIGLDEKSKLLRVVMLDYDNNRELEVSEFSGYTSSLHGNNYLNLNWLRPVQDQISGYMLVKYTVTAEKLGIAMMDRGTAKTAVTGGLLQGTVDEDDMLSPIHITAGQNELQEFILRNDKALFPEMKTIQRLNLPISSSFNDTENYNGY